MQYVQQQDFVNVSGIVAENWDVKSTLSVTV